MEDLAPGTHLVSPRWGYLHHGLYTGGGRVIHYAGFNRAFQKGRVEEVALSHFTRGRGLQVRARPAPQFAGPAAIDRARTRLGEDRYSFWSNNCEHFVEWCLSGTSRSLQVDSWRERVAAGLAAVSGWMAPRRPVGPGSLSS